MTIEAVSRNTTTGLSTVSLKYYFLTVQPAPPVWATEALTYTGQVGAALSDSLSATNAMGYTLVEGSLPPGVTLVTHAVSAGTLPDGLTLSSAGELTGTPSVAGVYTFTVTATSSQDSLTSTTTQDYTLNVYPTAPVFTTTSVEGAIAGTAYSQTITATAAPAATFAVTSGALPTGISLSSNGTLSGTTADTGSFTFTVEATSVADGLADSTSATFSLNVTPAPTYVVTSGVLPDGVALNTDGTLSGTPVHSGRVSFTVAATSDIDGLSASASQAFTLDIAPTRPAASPDAPSSVDLTVGSPYRLDLREHFSIDQAPTPGSLMALASAQSAVMGAVTPTLSFALTAGPLPAGLSLSTDGILSGTPTAINTTSATITVTSTLDGLSSSTASEPSTSRTTHSERATFRPGA